jgi:hypothetical protein
VKLKTDLNALLTPAEFEKVAVSRAESARNKIFKIFFNRETKSNFVELNYVSLTGSQPMNITWQLQHQMSDFMWYDVAKLTIGCSTTSKF